MEGGAARKGRSVKGERERRLGRDKEGI